LSTTVIHSDFWLLGFFSPAALNPGFRLRSTLGYHLTPLGLYKDEAASCRFTSAQFPASPWSDSQGAGRSRKTILVLSFQRGNFSFDWLPGPPLPDLCL